MQVLQGDYRVEELPLPASVMTLGNFDGVHRGHQFLLDHVRAGADQLGKPAVVLTFAPHPSHIVSGALPVPLLFSQEDQNREIAKRRVDFLVIQDFDEAFSELEAEDFLRQYLFPKFQPKKVVLGHDFSFGRGQKGNFQLFSQIAGEFGCQVQQVEPFEVDGDVLSSSKIRKQILQGNVKKAKRWLQRPYYLQSLVEKGEQLGRKIGFPTANMKGPFSLLPGFGVYFGRVFLEDQAHWAVINIGIRPTVDDSQRVSVEAHIIDFIGDIYGRELKCEFFERIRGEQKFPSLEDLKMQIDRDVEFARSCINKYV